MERKTVIKHRFPQPTNDAHEIAAALDELPPGAKVSFYFTFSIPSLMKGFDAEVKS